MAQGPDTLVNKEGFNVIVLYLLCNHILRDCLKSYEQREKVKGKTAMKCNGFLNVIRVETFSAV